MKSEFEITIERYVEEAKKDTEELFTKIDDLFDKVTEEDDEK